MLMLTDLPPSPSVGLCVGVCLCMCVSGKSTVAKRLIVSGCQLRWSVGSVEEWVY